MFSNNLIYILLFSLFNLALHNAFNVDEYTNAIKDLMQNSTFIQDFDNHLAECLSIDPDYFEYKNKFLFDCDHSPSEQAPRSVHKLRPSDIKVVGALGDSLTASVGTRARTIFGLLIEYREVSWSMGGEADLNKFLTLPNILKVFNPKLIGYSVKPSFVLTSKKGVGFNAAVSGQKAYHVIDQARTLIQRIKESKEVDYNNDWKLVTLFIGGNDLCQYCSNKTLHSPQSYIDDIKAALDLLQSELPRTLVNLVNALNVAEIEELNRGLVCSLLHKYECPCGAYPKSDQDRKELNEYFQGYSNYTEELVKTGRYDTKDDFTVVYQPFFRNFGAPRLPDGKIDITYFAPDCFHFSTKSQALAAVGLWNNMLQPVGKKATTFSVSETIACPTKDQPYIFTNLNSN